MCLLGKALTNGFPLAAIAGKELIMEKILDERDPVIAGGTFSGNIPGCAAGLAAIEIMEEPGFYEGWLSRVDTFMRNLQSGLDDEGFPARIQHLGCNFYIYVGTREAIVEYSGFRQVGCSACPSILPQMHRKRGVLPHRFHCFRVA